jgi:hypothetical protein
VCCVVLSHYIFSLSLLALKFTEEKELSFIIIQLSIEQLYKI